MQGYPKSDHSAMQINLEICAFSIDAVLIASKNGANRIELCSNPLEGGTTPHYGLVKLACQKATIPIYPIIRPRGGNFCYLDDEYATMKEDIIAFKKLGCHGVAIGLLMKNNEVDRLRLQEVVELAAPMGVTFIRAFDVTPNPEEALELIVEAGCERILTSGQATNAIEALPL